MIEDYWGLKNRHFTEHSGKDHHTLHDVPSVRSACTQSESDTPLRGMYVQSELCSVAVGALPIGMLFTRV